MTNEQILKKALEKAQTNGYSKFVVSLGLVRRLVLSEGYYRLVFKHDFAKTFWGYKVLNIEKCHPILIWEYHLQRMVLEKEPLKYLEKFLDKADK